MPFTEIKKGLTSPRETKNDVRVALSGSGQLVVSIPAETLARINNPERMTAAIGTGPDAGWLALYPSKSKSGYRVRYPENNIARTVSFRASAITRNWKKTPTTPVPFTATATSLYVDISSVLASRQPASIAAE